MGAGRAMHTPVCYKLQVCVHILGLVSTSATDSCYSSLKAAKRMVQPSFESANYPLSNMAVTN